MTGKKLPLIFGLTLFAIGITSIIYRTFSLNAPVFNAIFSLVDDSTGFLTVLCLAVIVCILIRMRHDKPLGVVALYLMDIFLINKLYSNTQWRIISAQLQGFLSGLDMQAVVFCGFLAAVIIWCFWVGWKSHSGNKRDTETEKLPPAEPGQPTTVQGEYKVNLVLQEGGEAGHLTSDRPDGAVRPDGTSGATPLRGDATGTPAADKKRPLTVSGVLLMVCTCVLGWFAMDVFIYELLPYNFTPPAGISWLLVLLQPLSIISVGIIAAIVIWRLISKIKSAGLGISETALVALLVEIVIIFVAYKLQDKDHLQILDKFLNSIADNTLIALVFVPVVLFILLHISISIIVGLLSKSKASEWLKDAETKITEVESGLVSFVFNIIIGFINLLLFVPDFFNHIGSVLLDEDDLFPQERIDTKAAKKGATDQKEQKQSGKGTSK